MTQRAIQGHDSYIIANLNFITSRNSYSSKEVTIGSSAHCFVTTNNDILLADNELVSLGYLYEGLGLYGSGRSGLGLSGNGYFVGVGGVVVTGNGYSEGHSLRLLAISGTLDDVGQLNGLAINGNANGGTFGGSEVNCHLSVTNYLGLGSLGSLGLLLNDPRLAVASHFALELTLLCNSGNFDGTSSVNVGTGCNVAVGVAFNSLAIDIEGHTLGRATNSNGHLGRFLTREGNHRLFNRLNNLGRNSNSLLGLLAIGSVVAVVSLVSSVLGVSSELDGLILAGLINGVGVLYLHTISHHNDLVVIGIVTLGKSSSHAVVILVPGEHGLGSDILYREGRRGSITGTISPVCNNLGTSIITTSRSGNNLYVTALEVSVATENKIQIIRIVTRGPLSNTIESVTIITIGSSHRSNDKFTILESDLRSSDFVHTHVIHIGYAIVISSRSATQGNTFGNFDPNLHRTHVIVEVSLHTDRYLLGFKFCLNHCVIIHSQVVSAFCECTTCHEQGQ